MANPWTRARHVELFFELLSKDRISVDNMISDRKHYSQAPEMYEMLLENRSQALGVILEWK